MLRRFVLNSSSLGQKSVRLRWGRTEMGSHIQQAVDFDEVQGGKLGLPRLEPKFCSFYTVPSGERVAIYDRKGALTFVDGPAKKFILSGKVQPLRQIIAKKTEFLRIVTREGEQLHLAGPIAVWQDPLKYSEITVMEGLQMGTGVAVVMYSEQDGKVSRKIVRGPACYTPTPTEWMHQFMWHGASPENRGIKVPNGLKFHKLRVTPSQMYFDVQSVRTRDDAVLTVQLMIFFELADIDLMLQNTHDPIADICNTISADVLEFAAARQFDQFKSESDHLNVIGTYPQLLEGASRVGFKINKVVFKGYTAGAKIQRMHDDAIEKRTATALATETELQHQELESLKLEKEQDRLAKQQAMEKSQVEHQKEMDRIRVQETLHLAALEHTAKLKQESDKHKQTLAQRKEHAANQHAIDAEKNELGLQHQKKLQELEAAQFRAMADLGVDLTQYLVAKETKPDQLVQMVNKSAVDGATDPVRLHLHQKAK
eukprot:TRINITY_DN59715_c0_g1_i1.p1 TRINITY_DN59715_c0_g1~~TRINITY_DN59715_c0_g1_i1.p1  ORF type:complete len:484 (-),score=64.70 TRINITY_DN59715_c0_g1_i1:147-1598(-)